MSVSSSQAHCLPRQIREGSHAVDGGSAVCGEEKEQFSGIVGELHQRNCSSPFFLPIRSTNPHIFRRWRGATPRSRSGGGAVRRYPSFKVRSSSWLCWSSCKEIPHIQGKRNPSKTVGVERGHPSANTLKP